MKELTCLRCGAAMHFLAKERLQLGKTSWILGDLPNLLAGSLETDLYVCPQCRRLEFYASENETQEAGIPKKTCPACGAVHDFDYPRCPKCKHSYYKT